MPRDPRLRLALVISSLQVLGQVALGFDVSIAQILACLLACGLVEVAVVWYRTRALAWPASALLTGNSVAFLLRAPGTLHGDWWSLHGLPYFLLAAVGGLASKWLLRAGGRHFFNPSNLGLVAVLLLVRPPAVAPQFLWWGPSLSWPVLLALAVIVGGGLWILRPLGLLPMVAAYLGVFWVGVAAIAGSGACFSAVWSPAPVCHEAYWLDVALSPELLVFVFFMISDPQTAPRSPRGRLAFGALVALAALALMAFQPSEFGVKVAILAGLTLVCALAPLARRPRLGSAQGLALATGLLVALGTFGLASDYRVTARDLPAPPGCPFSQAQAGSCP